MLERTHFFSFEHWGSDYNKKQNMISYHAARKNIRILSNKTVLLKNCLKHSKYLHSVERDWADVSCNVGDLHIGPKKIGLTPDYQNSIVKRRPVQPPDPRLLKVAIIGMPNTGKSTLANQLLGWKYSSVSNKVHTTRQKSIGVLTADQTQVVFLDTPGMISPHKKKKHNLELSLLLDPHSCLYEADLIAVVTDMSTMHGRNEMDPEIMRALHLHQNKDSILIMNKIDMVRPKHKLLKAVRVLTEGYVGGRKDSFKDSEVKPGQNKETYLETLFNKADKFISDINQSGLNRTNENNSQNYGSENVAESNSLSDYSLSKDYKINTSNCDRNFQGDVDVTRVSDISSNNNPVYTVVSDSGNSTIVTEQNIIQSPESSDISLTDVSQWSEYSKKLKISKKAVEGRSGWPHFKDVFMVSALEGAGVDSLRSYLLQSARPEPWMYHDAMITNQSPVELARMCVREKVMDNVYQDIPYLVRVEVTIWDVDESGLLRTGFELVCDTQRHFRAVVGKNGCNIKKIVAEAKQELCNIFQTDVTIRISARIKPKHK